MVICDLVADVSLDSVQTWWRDAPPTTAAHTDIMLVVLAPTTSSGRVGTLRYGCLTVAYLGPFAVVWSAPLRFLLPLQ